MTIEHVRSFWHDEKGRNMLPEVAGATAVLAIEPETLQGFVEARVKQRSLDTIDRAGAGGLIGDEDASQLASLVTEFHLPPDKAKKMAASYMALAVGYVGLGRMVDASELAFYGYAAHEQNAALGILAFVYGRLAGSVVNYGYTRATGKVLGIDLRLQAAVSAIPIIGPIPAMYVHTSQMVSSGIPEIVPISKQLVTNGVVDKAEAWNLSRIGVTSDRVRSVLGRIGLDT